MAQNIYAKLFNVQASCNALKRDAQGGTGGKFTFKYASLAEVQGEVNKYLAENKVLLNFEFYNAELIDDLIKVECRVKFINIEDIKENVIVVFPFLIDNNKSLNIVQCIGAAQTYARRYFLQNYFNLVTKESLEQDPDKFQPEIKKPVAGQVRAKDLVNSFFKDPELKKRWFDLLQAHPNFVDFGYKWSQYPKKDLKEMFVKMKTKVPPRGKGEDADLTVPFKNKTVSPGSAPKIKKLTPGDPPKEEFGEASEEEVDWDNNF